MGVTVNPGLNLYMGNAIERPTPGSAYSGALYRSSDTGQTWVCAASDAGYLWKPASSTFFAQTVIQTGDTIENTASATKFATDFILLGGALSVGKVMRLVAFFDYGSKASGAGTLILTLIRGASSVVWGVPVAYTLTDNIASGEIVFSSWLTCVADGASGSVEPFGLVTDAAAGKLMRTAAGAGITFDTTANQTFSLRATFGTADSANTITMRNLVIQILG